jgi:hypothetical protein
MKEFLFILAISLVFTTLSAMYSFISNRIRIIYLIISSSIYLICLWYLFDLVTVLIEALRKKGWNYHFGHANEDIVFVFLTCLLIAILNICWTVYKRRAGSRKHHRIT